VSLRDAKEVAYAVTRRGASSEGAQKIILADRRAVVEECKKVMFDYFSKNALYTDAIDALDRILEKKP
jgi:hypothetical protein